MKKFGHLIPEKNIVCAVATAALSIFAAHLLMQAGVDISPDGTTCITAARDAGLPYLSIDDIIYMVSALSIAPAYVWDSVVKYRSAKKAKGK